MTEGLRATLVGRFLQRKPAACSGRVTSWRGLTLRSSRERRSFHWPPSSLARYSGPRSTARLGTGCGRSENGRWSLRCRSGGRDRSSLRTPRGSAKRRWSRSSLNLRGSSRCCSSPPPLIPGLALRPPPANRSSSRITRAQSCGGNCLGPTASRGTGRSLWRGGSRRSLGSGSRRSRRSGSRRTLGSGSRRPLGSGSRRSLRSTSRRSLGLGSRRSRGSGS